MHLYIEVFGPNKFSLSRSGFALPLWSCSTFLVLCFVLLDWPQWVSSRVRVLPSPQTRSSHWIASSAFSRPRVLGGSSDLKMTNLNSGCFDFWECPWINIGRILTTDQMWDELNITPKLPGWLFRPGDNKLQFSWRIWLRTQLAVLVSTLWPQTHWFWTPVVYTMPRSFAQLSRTL